MVHIVMKIKEHFSALVSIFSPEETGNIRNVTIANQCYLIPMHKYKEVITPIGETEDRGKSM